MPGLVLQLLAGQANHPRGGSAAAADLTAVTGALAEGTITAQIAARVPLTSAPEAFRLAEARAKPGKVILLP